VQEHRLARQPQHDPAGFGGFGRARALHEDLADLALQGRYEVLKLVGAVYLVVLGVRGILQARSAGTEDEPAVGQGRHNRLAAFRAGLVTDLLNPKMGVFYLALLPQFVPAGGNVLHWSALLMSVEAVTAITSLVGYAVLAHVVGKVLKRREFRTWLERSLGTVLIGLGIRIAVT
jgi:threonine/homoserine/homoserine lactone efflux protein